MYEYVKRQRWWPYEIKRIDKYFKDTPAKDRNPEVLAKMLGRSKASVINKCNEIGLMFSDFSTAEDELIRTYYTLTKPEDFNLKTLARRMGRDYTAVCHRARLMGLTDIIRPKAIKKKETSAEVGNN